MAKKTTQTPNIVFKRKTTSFSMIANPIIDDKEITPAAGWLYVLIQRWITFNADDFICSKSFLLSKYQSGEKMFNRAWNELKDLGYLKMYCVGKSTWSAELLDQPQPDTPHTYYMNTAGEVTATNIDIAAKLAEIKKAKEENKEENNDFPEGNLRVPQKGVPLEGVPLKGIPLQGGNNINTLSNNSFNTFNNDYQSINHREDPKKAAQSLKTDRSIDMDLINEIKNQIDYNALSQGGITHVGISEGDLDIVVNILAALKTVNSPQEISGNTYTADFIHLRADSIKFEHIQYVFECFYQQREKIRNIKSYLTTAVFNAPATMGAYYSNKVVSSGAADLF